MSYKDKFGITKIVTDTYNNLSFSWDYDVDPEDKTKRTAVLLYTPDMNNTAEHYHVEINRQQAMLMRDWLSEFIEDTNPSGERHDF